MPADNPEERSVKLEKIRTELRKHLNNCDKMPDKESYLITQDTHITLTPSEQKALIRHIDASHGDKYIVDMTFGKSRRVKHQTSGTRIELHVIRRRKRRQYVRR